MRADCEPPTSAVPSRATTGNEQGPGGARPRCGGATVTRPLFPDQRELWIAQRLDTGDPASRVDVWELRFAAPVDRTALLSAHALTWARHPSLRAVVTADGTGQVFLPAAAVPEPGALPVESEEAILWIRREVRGRLESGREPGVCVAWENTLDGARLLFAADPSLLDRRSARVVLRDFVADYEAAVQRLAVGGDEGADPARMESADGSVTEAACEPSAESTAYWRAKLADLPEVPELPLDRRRPAVANGRAARHRRTLAEDCFRAVQDCCRDRGVTYADVLTAAWVALVHRLSGSSEFLLGRRFDGTAGAVGPYSKVRPLRVRCEGHHTFLALVQFVARESAEVARHLDAHPAAILRELRMPREAARLAAEGVLVAFDEANDAVQFGGAAVRVDFHPGERLDGDLALTVVSTARGAELELAYNADILGADTAGRWLRHLHTLLAAAVREPGCAVGELPLLGGDELEAIVHGFNRPAYPRLDGEALLHRAFETSAKARPLHPAVMSDDRTLAYAEVDTRANNLAHHLMELGAGPGGFVALVLDRSPEYAVATLAVLKSGAAFVPIDPEWPAERQALVMGDCRAAVVITAGRTVPPGTQARVVDLRDLEGVLSQRPGMAPNVDVAPSHLAYLIYTSGSTGVPKGVMVDHQAAAVHMASIACVYRIREDDRCLLFHSVAFDPAIEQLFAPWTCGATVYIRGEHLWTGREFSAWVHRAGITAVTLPPLYWLQLLRDWEHDPALAPVGQLRRVLVGGEALSPTVVELWRRLRLTSIRLLNGYGPTECTVTATVHELPATPSDDEACHRIPIGRPQGPVRAYVVDERMQIRPVGVPGELCLAGPTVARGYLGRASLTAERFLPSPWGGRDRMYRTGDRARFLPDGTIDFCGRADRQAKVGGYRVEPGEIEVVLGRSAGVQSCAVLVEPDERGTPSLVGYVVPVAPERFDESALRAQVAGELPRYMVPTRIFPVEALPRTVNGKLDTTSLSRMGAALRAREIGQRGAGEDDHADARRRDALESRVASIWCEVLDRPGVRATDDFFLSGGHSLLAVALYARLEREFSTQLALSDWLGEPTFAALTRLVRRGLAGSGGRRAEGTWRFLFPIRSGGARPRLFLFAGGRGCDEDFVVLAALTRALGDDQPVWGLRVGGPDRLEATHASARAIAADVAAELRRFQPEGPYHIAGECIGGLLAYEVARLLRADGCSVAFLGLINTGCPRTAEPFRWWISTSWVGRAKQQLGPLLGSLRHARPRDVLRHVRDYVEHVARSPHGGRATRGDGMPEDPRDYFYGRLLLRYRPERSDLPLTLFGCETYKRVANMRRWSRYAAAARLVPIPGNTTTCIREFAAESAGHLRDALNNASQEMELARDGATVLTAEAA